MLRHSLLDWWVACEMWNPPSLYTTLTFIDSCCLPLSLRRSGRAEKTCQRRSSRSTHTHTHIVMPCPWKKWACFILSDLERSLNIFNIHIRSHPQVLILLIPCSAHHCVMSLHEPFCNLVFWCMLIYFCFFCGCFQYIPVLLQFAPEITKVEVWWVA